MLTNDQKLIQQTAKDFATNILYPKANTLAKNKEFPVNELKELAKLGFMGMLLPNEYNGADIGYFTYSLAIEEIAAGDGSTSTILSVHNSVASLPILQFGTTEQKQKYLPKMANGELIGAFCLTEANAGSDAKEIVTTAKDNGDHYIIKGTKQFITSGKNADIAIVFARTNNDPKKGISAFIVPTDLPGYKVGRIEDKMGQECSDTAEIIFDNLRLPKENLLGNLGEGYKIALSNLEGGRIGIAAQCLGMARKSLELSLEYAKERITFNKPIIEHQAIAFKLSDMATKLEAARQLTHYAARLKDNKIKCIKEAAMAKLFASNTAIEICNEAIQIFGGYGYIKDFQVERIYRDVRVTTLYEGTSEIQKLVICKELVGK